MARGDNESEVMKLLEETVAKIKDRIGESIYSYNDEGIEEVVFKILKEKNNYIEEKKISELIEWIKIATLFYRKK